MKQFCARKSTGIMHTHTNTTHPSTWSHILCLRQMRDRDGRQSETPVSVEPINKMSLINNLYMGYFYLIRIKASLSILTRNCILDKAKK